MKSLSLNTRQGSKRLVSHPCILSVNEMGAARHFLKTALADRWVVGESCSAIKRVKYFNLGISLKGFIILFG